MAQLPLSTHGRRQFVNNSLQNVRSSAVLVTIDGLVCSIVFLLAGRMVLGYEYSPMYVPMLYVVSVCVLILFVFGLYRKKGNENCVRVFARFFLAFTLIALALYSLIPKLLPAYAENKFLFFYLFLTFFVLNTLRTVAASSTYSHMDERKQRSLGLPEQHPSIR